MGKVANGRDDWEAKLILVGVLLGWLGFTSQPTADGQNGLLTGFEARNQRYRKLLSATNTFEQIQTGDVAQQTLVPSSCE